MRLGQGYRTDVPAATTEWLANPTAVKQDRPLLT